VPRDKPYSRRLGVPAFAQRYCFAGLDRLAVQDSRSSPDRSLPTPSERARSRTEEDVRSNRACVSTQHAPERTRFEHHAETHSDGSAPNWEDLQQLALNLEHERARQVVKENAQPPRDRYQALMKRAVAMFEEKYISLFRNITNWKAESAQSMRSTSAKTPFYKTRTAKSASLKTMA
jgi:hypothetical protein